MCRLYGADDCAVVDVQSKVVGNLTTCLHINTLLHNTYDSETYVGEDSGVPHIHSDYNVVQMRAAA